jgi:hypothetical protein
VAMIIRRMRTVDKDFLISITKPPDYIIKKTSEGDSVVGPYTLECVISLFISYRLNIQDERKIFKVLSR